ncbi:hypothetical protein I4U23_028197 [Adineta vaga]|nr:hypothetical protein I4U23_028197 [Adineta vaga]
MIPPPPPPPPSSSNRFNIAIMSSDSDFATNTVNTINTPQLVGNQRYCTKNVLINWKFLRDINLIVFYFQQPKPIDSLIDRGQKTL